MMLRIIDRYILREIIPPFMLGLLVFTFLLMIPPIMEVAEELIAKGVDSVTIMRLMVTLIPQGLGLTIPIALLLGVLMGLGRLSSDREWVAIQACGVSLYRMLYPVVLLAVLASLATAYILIVALPDANQAYREITFRVLANRAEGEVKPRVFDEYFSRVVLYVREVSTSGGGWSEVFLADLRDSNQPDVYVAERGPDSPRPRSSARRDRPNRAAQVTLLIPHSRIRTRCTTSRRWCFRSMRTPCSPGAARSAGCASCRSHSFAKRPTGWPMRGSPRIARSWRFTGSSPFQWRVLIFALIGLALGVTSRKDGKLASFALGIGVVFAYYVLMYGGGEAMAKAAVVSPHLAMWIPNIVLGVFGVALLVWRSSSVERRITIPFLTRGAVVPPPSGADGETIGEEKAKFCIQVSEGAPVRESARLVRLTGLLRHCPTLVRGAARHLLHLDVHRPVPTSYSRDRRTGLRLLEYFWYATPQFVYYVLPISALVASLVTIGLLTKSSELTVRKACGISLYRAALPIFLISLVWSGVLFGMSETILARANRRAEALNREIRTGVARTADVMHRRWVVGEAGSIYHYLSFDPELDEFGNLSVYDFSGSPWSLERRTYVEHAAFNAEDGEWEGHGTWVRDLSSTSAEDKVLLSADTRRLPFLEPPDFFETERPDAELMSFRELDGYVDELSASGFDVVQLVVALHRKVSFPFVTLILTLIAVPFAVTMGPRGALYGVGVGIAIACSYWIILSVFGAIGSAGLLAPILAAWAPNLLFGASATYLLLTVRT